MGSNRRRLITLAVIGMLIAPAVVDRDGFPLATYPMYARPRAEVVAVPTATGLTGTGSRQRLSLDIIGESDDPLIVAALLRDAVSGREEQRQDLCRRIADRAVDAGLAADQNTEGDTRQNTGQDTERDTGEEIERVELATEIHDVIERVSNRPSLVERRVHATCPVDR